MLCAISGEAPQVPVASRKSGNVYEKRLIEAYISENGVEPTSGEAITTEDLVDLRTPKSVRPRPPTLTSIPSLLGVFQEEWDALALETFTLRQNLAQTRQDLSNALYQHDAAVRVIARLTKERDEAREALSKVNVGIGATSNGDAMHVDPTPLPQNIVAKIEETHVSLSKTRRKRGVPAEWATGDDVEAYTSKRKFKAGYRGSTALSVRASGDLALVGTSEGMAAIYSMSQDKMSAKLPGGGGIITGAVWAGEQAVISTSKGKVLVYNDAGEELGAFEAHTGSATSIALHPTEDILASVGKDQTYVLYDLEAMKVLTQVACDGVMTCVKFHPDGHLLAAGSLDGKVRVYDVKSYAQAAVFEIGNAVKTLTFSENGIWLAVVIESSSAISIWDIRKTAEVHRLETRGQVSAIDWDYTGQFLASAGASGVRVHQYSKSTKVWKELLMTKSPAQQAAWAQSARKIITANEQGVIEVLA